MDQEEISQRLEDIIEKIKIQQEQADKRCEKMEVSLTGTLRLLSDNTSMIHSLQGNPDALKGYLLRETSNLRNSTFADWTSILALLQTLLNDLRK
ncbi:MAG: hypothetical protein K9W43_07815 [Candidatus Thorarchaeota archaeon]|nr:hypothetical protein [Candidatus Thorarchaeota archaeon]